MSAHRHALHGSPAPAHRGRPRERRGLRRTFTAAVLAVTSGVGFLAAAGPANAAGPWFVASSGNNANPCTSAAAPCATVTGVLGKAGFVSGDTINVAQGTYTDHPTFAAKTANVVGGGTGAVFTGGNAFFAIGVNIGNANTLTLNNLVLTQGRNLTNNLGGGLVIATGKVVANNVTLNANGGGAITQGGGAYVVAGAGLTMNGGAVTGNTVTGQGGGVYGAGTTVLNGTTVTGNTAGQTGGAVYATGTTTVTGGSLSGNTALNAGAAFVAGTTVLDGTTVDNNTANGGALTNGGNGGAFYNAGLLTIKNATMTGNKAVANTNATPGIAGYGGAIFGANAAANAPVITLTDTTINGGAVSGGNAAVGGAIAVYPTTVGGTTTRIDATRLTLSKNVALAGGGIYTYGAATLTGSTLDQNQATHASAGLGGGVYATAASGTTPTLTVDNTRVTGNTAKTGGGGLTMAAGVTTEVRNGSMISGNSGPIGGGVYNGGVLTVRSSNVDGNTASNSGAGIYSLGSSTLVGSSVDGNSAAFLGGGVVTGGGTLTATGGHISGNSAFGAGGVLVGDNLPASFDGTDFVGNTATGSGGGAILNGGSTTITRASLTGNRAAHTTGNTGLGGAIYSGSNNGNVNTRLTVSSSTIAGNDAYAGSALITYSPGTGATNKTSIDNTTIDGNTSTSAAGAIEQFHPLTITNSTLTGNTASGADAFGALYMFAPAQVGVAGTIVAGNGPAACSGAVSDGGHNLAAPGDTGCGFSAARQDVGADPQLGGLTDNGGPTETRLPGPASPALGQVPVATTTGLSDAVTGTAVSLCAAGAQDQRGTARPQGAKCDIGAVEAVQVAPTVDGPADADYTVGSAGAPVTFTTTGTPQAALSASGDIPAGVTFHDNGDGTGTLSGTPAANTGGEHTITVAATNEAGSATTTILLKVHQAPVLSGPSAATYMVGQAGDPQQFTQTSGYPDAALSTSSTLPGGVTFTPEPGGHGTLAGTPTSGAGGVYPITIDGSNGTPPDAHWPFTLTVDEAPSLDGPGSATFIVGSAGASGTFTAAGYPVPTISGTGLPAGLSIAGTGSAKITGTPADGTGGEYDATVTATNGVGADASAPVHVVVDEAPELTGPTDARFVAGSASTIAFSSDGYPAATVSLTGALPAGLGFDSHPDGTATISGSAAASSVGSYAVTVTADNGIDPPAVIHLTIDVVPAVAITTTSLPGGAVGTAYSALVAASGGEPPYSFSLESGSLPAGLTLHGDGTVTGTPTGPTGTSTFTVKVTDHDDPAHSDTRQLSITIGRGVTTLAVDPVVLQTTGGLGLRVGIVRATLTGGFPAQPIAGQTIVFKAGGTTVCTGVTGADGKVSCDTGIVNAVLVILNLGVTGSYAGNALWQPATGSAGLAG